MENTGAKRFFERFRDGNDVIIRFNFGLQSLQFVLWG